MWMTGLQATARRRLSGPTGTDFVCMRDDLGPLGLKEVFFEGGPDTRAGDGVSHLSLHLSNVAVERHQKHN